MFGASPVSYTHLDVYKRQALAAAHLVAGQQHRDALRQEQGCQKIALLTQAQLQNLRIVSLAFSAAIPGAVVAFPVAVALAVGFIALFVVADQIAQGETVVGDDEIDAGAGIAPVGLIQICLLYTSRCV